MTSKYAVAIAGAVGCAMVADPAGARTKAADAGRGRVVADRLMVRSVRWVSALAVASVALTIIAATQLAAADPDPSPEKGHELAQKLCRGCHVIESGADSNAPVGVPTFRSIANRPGQTGERITNILIQPHAPMPDIRLTREEIQNILSYLETLRTDQTIPPLLPPSTRPKPTYPWPS